MCCARRGWDASSNTNTNNYSKGALGQTPTPLNDGDVLSMGTYELIVTEKKRITISVDVIRLEIASECF